MQASVSVFQLLGVLVGFMVGPPRTSDRIQISLPQRHWILRMRVAVDFAVRLRGGSALTQLIRVLCLLKMSNSLDQIQTTVSG